MISPLPIVPNRLPVIGSALISGCDVSFFRLQNHHLRNPTQMVVSSYDISVVRDAEYFTWQAGSLFKDRDVKGA